MPPKIRITKEDILSAAVEIIRQEGAAALNARAIASSLHCSTQPIFSNFESMDTLRTAVIDTADNLCRTYRMQEENAGIYPPYKAHGMAYIRFAKQEKELFKLLYMRDRTEENTLQTDGDTQMETIVQHNTGLNGTDAKLFHLEMWAYVHGIAAMFATGYLDLDWELVSQMLTDAYQGLRKQHKTE